VPGAQLPDEQLPDEQLLQNGQDSQPAANTIRKATTTAHNLYLDNMLRSPGEAVHSLIPAPLARCQWECAHRPYGKGPAWTFRSVGIKTSTLPRSAPAALLLQRRLGGLSWLLVFSSVLTAIWRFVVQGPNLLHGLERIRLRPASASA